MGMPVSVYLSIPGNRTGAGKVTIKIENRTMEYSAATRGDALPTGAHVEVVGVLAPNMLEAGRPPHH